MCFNEVVDESKSKILIFPLTLVYYIRYLPILAQVNQSCSRISVRISSESDKIRSSPIGSGRFFLGFSPEPPVGRDVTIPMRYWGIGIGVGGSGRYWYWLVSVLVLVGIGIGIGRYWYWYWWY